MKTLITFLCIAIGIAAHAQEPEDNILKSDTLKSDSLKPYYQAGVAIVDGRLKAELNSMNPDSTKSDTTIFELKNRMVTVIKYNKTWSSDDGDDEEDKGRGSATFSKKYRLTWWNGIDLGVNGILSGNHDFKLSGSTDFMEPKYGKSRYISFNMGQVKGRIVKDYVGFTMGAAIQVYNYKYSGENEFVFAGDSLFSMPSGDKNITKNKLRVSYLAVPALLEFNTSLDPHKSFHISAGVVGKIRIENMYKQKFSLAGNENKTSVKGDLGMNRWAADAMVRVGYRRLTVFAQVGLLPLFDNANTDDVYSFAAGLYIKV